MNVLEWGTAGSLVPEATCGPMVPKGKSMQETWSPGKYFAPNRKESGAGKEVCASVITAWLLSKCQSNLQVSLIVFRLAEDRFLQPS